jgi:2-dehydro-3-deoxygluconokinase
MSSQDRIVCFGEMLLRLSPPGDLPLLAVPELQAHFGGAETNVAVGLAQLGHDVAMATCLPDDDVGDAALRAIRQHGVDTRHVARGPGRLGLYYFLPGIGRRASRVIYDRAHSLFSLAAAPRLDWDALLEGAGWLHLSGITPALGPAMAETVMEVIALARSRGVRISFDGNYRALLWESWCVDPGAILRAILQKVSLLIGNHRDISLALDRDFSGETPESRREAALAAFETFPDLEAIASTSRRTESNRTHHLAARLDLRGRAVTTAEIRVDDVVDRIGTGDAFTAGVLHGAVSGNWDIERALDMAVLKHYVAGDFSAITPKALDKFRHHGLDVHR